MELRDTAGGKLSRDRHIQRRLNLADPDKILDQNTSKQYLLSNLV